MNAWKRLDERLSAGRGRTLWQFVKFNLVSLTVTILQLLLANLLPLAFDRVVSPLPPLLRGIFRADALFPDGSKYVVNGVVTWGYVLPFLLANGLANIYGYFINMKTTFRGKGTRAGFAVYLAILFALILFATWMQGEIVAAAGIGNPARFFNTLRQAGLSFSEMPLPDHFDFSFNPFAQVRADRILITEKDAVKCAQIAGLKDDGRLWVVPVRAEFDDNEPERRIVEKCRGCQIA